MRNFFIDTDISDDIDDLWALLLTLNIPDSKILGISLSMGDTDEKARFVADILTRLHRDDIPLFIGTPTSKEPNPHRTFYQDYDLDSYRGSVYRGMAEATAIFKSVDHLTFLALAPLTNVRSLYELNPILKEKAELVIMGGAIDQGYLNQEKPAAEYNILMDIPAAKYVFKNIPGAILCPLDVCRDYILSGDAYQKIRQSHTLNLTILMENYRLWDKNYVGGAIKFDVEQSSTILYDVIPVLFSLQPDLFECTQVRLDVRDDGSTPRNPGGAFLVHALIGWKRPSDKYALTMKLLLGGELEN